MSGNEKWKNNFNPNPTKQAREVIFSRKPKKIYHPPLVIIPVFLSHHPKNTRVLYLTPISYL